MSLEKLDTYAAEVIMKWQKRGSEYWIDDEDRTDHRIDHWQPTRNESQLFEHIIPRLMKRGVKTVIWTRSVTGRYGAVLSGPNSQGEADGNSAGEAVLRACLEMRGDELK